MWPSHGLFYYTMIPDVFSSFSGLFNNSMCRSICDWPRAISDRATGHFWLLKASERWLDMAWRKENLCCVYQALKKFHTSHLTAHERTFLSFHQIFQIRPFKSHNTSNFRSYPCSASSELMLGPRTTREPLNLQKLSPVLWLYSDYIISSR